MHTKRILIADDDRELVMVMAFRLSVAGYETAVAFDGEKALQTALGSRPDLIVLDVRMPGMDGLSMLDRLREHQDMQALPVIMLSASLGDKRTALNAGARYFLPKPYDGKELLQAIDSVLSPRPIQQ